MTNQQDRNSAELSASGGQLLRELTERARAGGLTLTGEGGLSGKLVSGSVLRADEPIPGASAEIAGRIAPGRQSGLGVNAGAGLGGPPPGVPHARLGGRGVIADAGGMDAG
ncbi:MAG TPA: hypothetical protein VGI96_45550 [Streptosporangiaceae bacterium]